MVTAVLSGLAPALGSCRKLGHFGNRFLTAGLSRAGRWWEYSGGFLLEALRTATRSWGVVKTAQPGPGSSSVLLEAKSKGKAHTAVPKDG